MAAANRAGACLRGAAARGPAPRSRRSAFHSPSLGGGLAVVRGWGNRFCGRAGVLHDVIEDTAAAASDLQGRLGRKVTDLVVARSARTEASPITTCARRPCGPRSRPPVATP